MSRIKQVLIAVWLVVAAFMGYLLIGLGQTRQAAEQRVRDQAMSYARLVEQHATATFDRADIALMGVIDHLRPGDLTAVRLSDARRREVEELLLSQQQRSPGIIALYVTGGDGHIIAISLGAQPGTDLSDRAYFQSLKAQPGAGLAVSEVVYGRVSKKWGTMAARRVDLPDGSFGGIVGANLGLTENFSDFYATLSLGRDSTVSLRDPDNRLLVRYPLAEEKLGMQMESAGPITERLFAAEPEGVLAARSVIDNVERMFAFRKSRTYPVYAVVGLSLEDALAGWRRDRDTAWIAAVLLVLAGIFITVALRRKESADRLVHELNDTLEARVRERTDELASANRQLQTEIMERKRAESAALDYADRLAQVTRRTVNVLEAERRRLARELHDRVSSNLTAIGLNLDLIDGQLSREEQARIGSMLYDCAGLAEDAATSARDISSDLHPAILDYMGIVPALKDLAEKFARRANIEVGVRGPEQGARLPSDREIALFRIAQEALVNCAKHSRASSVSIQLDYGANRIEMSIKDDGAGFDRAEAALHGHTPGLGLLSMQERAQAVGGNCRIDSTPGRGTRVVVELPR